MEQRPIVTCMEDDKLSKIRRGEAWLRYVNHFEKTFLMCEQKPYLMWFSYRRKSYPEKRGDNFRKIPLAQLYWHQSNTPSSLRYFVFKHTLIACC